jgi:hypothetical protein
MEACLAWILAPKATNSLLLLWQFLNIDHIRLMTRKWSSCDVKDVHIAWWTYYIHGIMMEVLVNTYQCATTCKPRLMKNLVPTPFSTSPTFPSSTFQMGHFTTSNLCQYSVIKPNHSSQCIPQTLTLQASPYFLTYNFKVFMYLSIGYIRLIQQLGHPNLAHLLNVMINVLWFKKRWGKMHF